MTGALGFLGAPRQRSASNLSLARQARPSGSVIKTTLLALSSSLASSLGLRLRIPYASACALVLYAADRVALLHMYIWWTGRLRRRLCAMVCPPSDRLEDRHRVAHNEKAAKVNLAGLLVLAGRRRRTQTQMQTRGAVWQLRPDAPIAPARWSLGRPPQHPVQRFCPALSSRC